MQISAQPMKFSRLVICYMYLCNIITLILSLKNVRVFMFCKLCSMIFNLRPCGAFQVKYFKSYDEKKEFFTVGGSSELRYSFFPALSLKYLIQNALQTPAVTIRNSRFQKIGPYTWHHQSHAAGSLISLIALRTETALLYQFGMFFLLVGQTVGRKNRWTNRPSHSNS